MDLHKGVSPSHEDKRDTRLREAWFQYNNSKDNSETCRSVAGFFWKNFVPILVEFIGFVLQQSMSSVTD